MLASMWGRRKAKPISSDVERSAQGAAGLLSRRVAKPNRSWRDRSPAALRSRTEAGGTGAPPAGVRA